MQDVKALRRMAQEARVRALWSHSAEMKDLYTGQSHCLERLASIIERAEARKLNAVIPDSWSGHLSS